MCTLAARERRHAGHRAAPTSSASGVGAADGVEWRSKPSVAVAELQLWRSTAPRASSASRPNAAMAAARSRRPPAKRTIRRDGRAGSAHAGQIVDAAMPSARRRPRVADAGALQEQRGEPKAPAASTTRPHSIGLAAPVADALDAATRSPSSEQARDERRRRRSCSVRALAHGIEVGEGGVPAHAVGDVDGRRRDAEILVQSLRSRTRGMPSARRGLEAAPLERRRARPPRGCARAGARVAPAKSGSTLGAPSRSQPARPSAS